VLAHGQSHVHQHIGGYAKYRQKCPMKNDCDILIVGGGLSGPILALALAQTGLKVVVVDALKEKVRKNAAFNGRSYAIALTSQRLLNGIGIWDEVKSQSEPILEIKVTEGRAGEGPSPFFMHFDHAEIEEGPMGYMVQDRYLRHALLKGMEASLNITHLSGQKVTNQIASPSNLSVTLNTGKILTTGLLIGADGRSSGTAKRAQINGMAGTMIKPPWSAPLPTKNLITALHTNFLCPPAHSLSYHFQIM